MGRCDEMDSKTTNIIEALSRKVENVIVVERNKPNIEKAAEAFHNFLKK